MERSKLYSINYRLKKRLKDCLESLEDFDYEDAEFEYKILVYKILSILWTLRNTVFRIKSEPTRKYLKKAAWAVLRANPKLLRDYKEIVLNIDKSACVVIKEIKGKKVEIDNISTYIDKDASNNMTFTDAVTGTKTLADLAAGASTFLDLTDTPSSYTGQAGKFARVKSTEDGLEFATVTAAAKATLVINEDETSVTGTTESLFPYDKSCIFVKDSTIFNVTSLDVILKMKVSTAGYTATIKLYIDDEVTPKVTFTSTSTTYEIKTASIDVSGYADGEHKLVVKGYTNAAGVSVDLEFYHCMGVV